MKTTQLFIGDEQGLRDATWIRPEGYTGRTGRPAREDQEFVNEVVRRRSALKLSAIGLGRETELSNAYISMLENGTRFASEEAKAHIRETLDRLESEAK